MSYWLRTYTNIGKVTINDVTYDSVVGVCYADTPSDLPPRIIGMRALSIGSTCTDVSTGNEYMMDTYGQWNLQPSDSSITLDLTGYYTIAQTDTAIGDAITSNNANYYDKTYIDINYYEKVEIDGQVADLTTLANGKMPLKYADYTTIPDGRDLSTYTTPGVYVRTTSSAGIAGRPSDYQSAFLLIVRNTSAESRYQQELYPMANVSGAVQHFFYKRYYTAAGWQDWTKFAGTAVAPYVPTP